MAMKYGGECRPEWIRRRHLDRLGDDLGIATRRVRIRALEMAERVGDLRPTAREELPADWRGAPILDAIDETVEEMSDVLRRAAREAP